MPNPLISQESALPIGAPVGGCVVEKVLATSEVGFVYLGRDVVLHRKVAIKEYFPRALCVRSPGLQVLPARPEDAEPFKLGLQAFLEEARLLARLEHPGLVRVLGVFGANQTAYRTMLLADGRSLLQALETRPHVPDAAWVRSLIDDLLTPLESLHKADLVHGNIQPSQVMLLTDGRPLLLGFGAVRKALQPDAPDLSADVYAGAYSPPELLPRAVQPSLGPWTDLYSVAALAWFAATGKEPMAAGERTAGAAFDVRGPLVSGLAAQAAQDPSMAALILSIERALQIKPLERPASVVDFRALLAQHSSPPMFPTIPMESAVAIQVGSSNHAAHIADGAVSAISLGPFAESQPMPTRDVAIATNPRPDSPEHKPQPVQNDDVPLWVSEPTVAPKRRRRPARHSSRRDKRSSAWGWLTAAGFAAALVLAAGVSWQWNKAQQASDVLAYGAPAPSAVTRPAGVLSQESTPKATDLLDGLPPTSAGAPQVNGSRDVGGLPTPMPDPVFPAARNQSEAPAIPVTPSATTTVPTAAPKSISPRVICSGRSNFALLYCMQQQCANAQWRAHPQCTSLQATGEVD